MPSLIIRCCFFLTFLLCMSHVSLLHASSAACPIEWVKLYTYVPCTCVFALLSFRDTWACCRLFYLNPSPFLSPHYHFLSLSLPFKQRKLPFFYYQIESFLLPPLLHAAYAKLCLFNENLLFDSQALSSQLQTAVQKMSLARWLLIEERRFDGLGLSARKSIITKA